jgi:hypothetical protein
MREMEEWKNYLRKLTLKGLTADCVRRKIKIIKPVYSQELNKIMKSKKCGTGINDLCKPELVRFDIHRSFLWNSVFYEASCFLNVNINLNSWCWNSSDLHSSYLTSVSEPLRKIHCFIKTCEQWDFIQASRGCGNLNAWYLNKLSIFQCTNLIGVVLLTCYILPR